jgi:hypothetical protein
MTAIPRINLPEIEDQKWCPDWIRNSLTEYLESLFVLLKPYRAVHSKLLAVLELTKSTQIVDLCSGSGGPAQDIQKYLDVHKKNISVVLTDQYLPSSARRAFLEKQKIAYHPASVDARAVPKELKGFRTMFTALHHFRKDEVAALIVSAMQDSQGFAAFEITERSLRGLLVIFSTPLIVLAITPFIRPLKVSRLFFTYVIPVLPLLITWDGLASMFKSYSTQELIELAADFPEWHWEVGLFKSGTLLPVRYIIGRKLNSSI